MRKFSRKQIGAVGLAVMMSAQGPVMAAEVAQEETTSAVEVQTEEDDVTLPETVEESTEETTEQLAESESTEEITIESIEESESESEEAEIESESALESTESENAELDETAEAAYGAGSRNWISSHFWLVSE